MGFIDKRKYMKDLEDERGEGEEDQAQNGFNNMLRGLQGMADAKESADAKKDAAIKEKRENALLDFQEDSAIRGALDQGKVEHLYDSSAGTEDDDDEDDGEGLAPHANPYQDRTASRRRSAFGGRRYA